MNKLDIRDEAALQEAETMLVLVESAKLEETPPTGRISFGMYKEIHRALFGQLYTWAGTVRTVELAKKGTHFYPANEIERCGTALFEKADNLLQNTANDKNAFAKELAAFYNELNLLHPFREGNGRAQRLFIALYVRRAGFDLDFAACDTDELMMATIYAAQGVTDYLQSFFLGKLFQL